MKVNKGRQGTFLSSNPYWHCWTKCCSSLKCFSFTEQLPHLLTGSPIPKTAVILGTYLLFIKYTYTQPKQTAARLKNSNLSIRPHKIKV